MSANLLHPYNKTREELKLTENYFNRIFDSFDDPLAIYDRDYRILQVNQALLQFYQHMGEPIGQHCYKFFYNRNSICKNCHTKKVFLSGKPHEREISVSLPNCSQRHFEVHAYPLKNARGATIQVIEHCRDITERKILETRLKTSEEKYRSIVEMAREGIFIVDAEGKVILANDFLARMFGYTRVEDIIGRPLVDFIAADWVMFEKTQLKQRTHSFSCSCELPLRRPDGSSLVSLVAAAPLMINGSLLGSVGVATDITDLKNVENELRSAKEFREKIINGITDNLVVIDPRTYRIIQANDSFLDRVGLNSKAVLGKPCYQVMLRRNSPCKEEGISCTVRQAAREKQTAFGDRVYPDAQGKDRILEISSYPLLDNRGDVDLVIRLERDVTDERKMEEALAFRSRELQKTQHQLETLFEISRQINAKDSLNELITALITQTKEIFPESEPFFLILNADTNHFLHLGPGLDHIVEQPGLVADFIRYLGKIQDHQAFGAANGPHTQAFFKIISEIYPSWFGLPILVQRQCIGLFLVGSRRALNYKADINFIQALLDQTAGHIRSLVLHEAEINQLRRHQAVKISHGGLIGRSQKMQEVYDLIDLVSASDATVLITGENGTGKELAAQAIHQQSHRSKGPFIVANCSAYSQTLLESELFGHEKGSFTGAIRQKKGRIERAHGGTLFLDEIGDISPATQVLLLRFLQDYYFERVGGEKTIEANVRIIAATNQDLQKAVETGGFRVDLYYRLNVIAIHMPPLRERKEDIPMLCRHFLSKCNLKEKKNIQKISANAMQTLMDYDWPGNVRQLENAISHAVIITLGQTIRRRHLPRFLKEGMESLTSTSLAENERRLIVRVLQEANWNKHEAARRLQLTRSTLYSKMRRYSIENPAS